jgi:hypothetical protein
MAEVVDAEDLSRRKNKENLQVPPQNYLHDKVEISNEEATLSKADALANQIWQIIRSWSDLHVRVLLYQPIDIIALHRVRNFEFSSRIAHRNVNTDSPPMHAHTLFALKTNTSLIQFNCMLLRCCAPVA